MSLEAFNAMSNAGARAALALCCVSDGWLDGMLARRPFADENALRSAADEVWSGLGESDFLQWQLTYGKGIGRVFG